MPEVDLIRLFKSVGRRDFSSRLPTATGTVSNQILYKRTSIATWKEVSKLSKAAADTDLRPHKSGVITKLHFVTVSVQYKLRHNFKNETAILTDVTNTYKNLHVNDVMDMLLTLNKNTLTKLLVWLREWCGAAV